MFLTQVPVICQWFPTKRFFVLEELIHFVFDPEAQEEPSSYTSYSTAVLYAKQRYHLSSGTFNVYIASSTILSYGVSNSHQEAQFVQHEGHSLFVIFTGVLSSGLGHFLPPGMPRQRIPNALHENTPHVVWSHFQPASYIMPSNAAQGAASTGVAEDEEISDEPSLESIPDKIDMTTANIPNEILALNYKTARTINYPIGEVLQLKKCRQKNVADEVVGIEIENEWKDLLGKDWPRVRNWHHEEDHSLRYNGMEYVSTPLKSSVYAKHVQELCAALQKLPQPTNSIRTSIHVHTDVSQWNFIQILTFACTYWILEDYVSHFAGSDRMGNLFCLRLKDTCIVQTGIKQIVRRFGLQDATLINHNNRYSSLNFASLQKFGTLEFRLMRGTLDAEEINTWVAMILQMQRFSRQFKNPKHLLEVFLKDYAAKDFPQIVLGEKVNAAFQKAFNMSGSILEKSIREGVFNMMDIADASPTWDWKKEMLSLDHREKEIREMLERMTKRKKNWTSMVFANATSTSENYDMMSSSPHINFANDMAGLTAYEGEDL